MEDTYIIRWTVDAWCIWFCDGKGRLRYQGTYHGNLSEYVADMGRCGYNAIIMGR